MFQYFPGLLECHAGKPLHELRHQCPVFKILKKRRHGHTGTAKNPRAAEALRIALDR